MAEPTFRFSPRSNRAHEIHWRPWGESAFEEAAQHEKPILLSISAVWCHWCHVMDETSYSDDSIISLINEKFIPIRVDNDQRPDVNLRYNMGGWPTTALLTPVGEIIAGGTYLSPEQMTELLNQVLEYWKTNKDEIKDRVVQPEAPKLVSTPESPLDEILESIVNSVREQYDRAYGGIGVAPKFPIPDVWELCLALFTATGDGWTAGMAVRTLDVMAGGNLYDQIEGGFFRYSTTREWSIPHFEKMLEDNALLARLYLKAYQILGDESYRQVAEGVLNWANKTLLNSQGLWGGSQDANEEYYVLPLEERQQRQAPFVDPIIHTNWNALMISAQLMGAALIDSGTYAPVALTALEALWDTMWDEEAGLHHFSNEHPELTGQLSDVQALGHALVDAYEYTGDPVYLERCHELLDYADRTLWSKPAYYDQISREDALGRLKHRQQPLAENAYMARLIIRLGTIEDDDSRIQKAQQILEGFSSMAKEHGTFAAAWGLSYDMLNAPALTANLVESSHRSGAELRQAIFGVFDRKKAIRTFPVGSPAFQQTDYPEIPVPALYLCRDKACAAPVTSPEGIVEALQSLFQQVSEA